MKQIKKIMAVLITMVMVLGMMSMAALAAPGDAASDSSISVTGLAKGDVVTPYQVIHWVDGSGWAFTDTFAYDETNNPNGLKKADLDVILGDPTATPAVEGKITQALADKIALLARGGTADPAVGTDGKWEKTEPASGLYMVAIAAADAGTVYNPAFVGADFSTSNTTNTISIEETYSDTSVAKKTTIDVKKTTQDADSAKATAIDSYIGQEVTFYVDTTIPVFLDSYQNPSFVINDTIQSSGVEFKTGTIKVTLGSGDTAVTYTEDAANILDIEEDGTSGYSVTFDDDYLKGNDVAVPVHIEYKGTITNDATYNANEDDNEVTVTYSNGPTNEKAALRDRTNHYTFSIGADILGESEDSGKTYELVKVGTDSNGNPVISKSEVGEWSTKVERHPLAGATFGLYSDAACTIPYSGPSEYSGANTFTTGADGIITFKGLAAGTYYIMETDAPDGFIKDTRKVKVEIEAHYKNVTVPATVEDGIKVASYDVEVLDYYTVKVNNVSVLDNGKYGAIGSDDEVVNTYRFENNGAPAISNIAESSELNDGDLVNTKGVELPSTGGIGTTIFYVIGAVLVLGAGVLLVTRRRMNAE